MGSYFYGFMAISISKSIYENSYLRRSKYTILSKICCRFEFLTVDSLVFNYCITCILYILEFNLLVYTKLYLLSKNIYLYSLKLLVLCEYWPETATNVKFQKFFRNVMLANRSLETCFAFI